MTKEQLNKWKHAMVDVFGPVALTFDSRILMLIRDKARDVLLEEVASIGTSTMSSVSRPDVVGPIEVKAPVCPMQPIVTEGGVHRFKTNKVVRYLLDNGSIRCALRDVLGLLNEHPAVEQIIVSALREHGDI